MKKQRESVKIKSYDPKKLGELAKLIHSMTLGSSFTIDEFADWIKQKKEEAVEKLKGLTAYAYVEMQQPTEPKLTIGSNVIRFKTTSETRRKEIIQKSIIEVQRRVDEMNGMLKFYNEML